MRSAKIVCSWSIISGCADNCLFLYVGGCLPRGCVYPERVSSERECLPAGVCGRHLPRGGVCLDRQTPPEMTTAMVGTHPTGMHSSLMGVFVSEGISPRETFLPHELNQEGHLTKLLQLRFSIIRCLPAKSRQNPEKKKFGKKVGLNPQPQPHCILGPSIVH